MMKINITITPEEQQTLNEIEVRWQEELRIKEVRYNTNLKQALMIAYLRQCEYIDRVRAKEKAARRE